MYLVLQAAIQNVLRKCFIAKYELSQVIYSLISLILRILKLFEIYLNNIKFTQSMKKSDHFVKIYIVLLSLLFCSYSITLFMFYLVSCIFSYLNYIQPSISFVSHLIYIQESYLFSGI